MKSLVFVSLCLSFSASAVAAEFKLEGYDREVNDATVVRESEEVEDVVAVRFHCCRISDASLKHVSRWPDLRGVYLRDTAITGTGFSRLKDHRHLKQVTLVGPNVIDEGIASLAKLNHVTHLAIGNGYRWDGLLFEPQITDASLKAVAEMKTVQYLSIDNAKITDDGLIHLGELSNARNIQFFRCKELTEDGLSRLRRKLPKCDISAHVPNHE